MEVLCMTDGLDQVDIRIPTPRVSITSDIFHRFVNGSPEVAVKALEEQVNLAFRELTENLNNELRRIEERCSSQLS